MDTKRVTSMYRYSARIEIEERGLKLRQVVAGGHTEALAYFDAKCMGPGDVLTSLSLEEPIDVVLPKIPVGLLTDPLTDPVEHGQLRSGSFPLPEEAQSEKDKARLDGVVLEDREAKGYGAHDGTLEVQLKGCGDEVTADRQLAATGLALREDGGLDAYGNHRVR